MFKRANKVTALLVAAASIMSVVPAMAADTTKLSNKDGTVKQGIAFGDGSYAYYGYRTDDDDTGIYYNNDGGKKDTYNDDLEDYRFNNDSKFGTKYAYAQENSNEDEYLVDLSTGKAVDDETAEDKAEDANSDLVSKLKRADRYEDLITNSSDLATIFDSASAKNNAVGTFDQILKGQFGEVWYQYQVTTGAGVDTTYYTGFSDEKGNYIDLSQETNIRVFSTYTGRAEWIKEYDDKDKDSKLTVSLLNVKPLAQDKDYIYTLTAVKVKDDNATEAGVIPQATTQFFVQKISKAQGGKDDGDAITAKSIDSYQLQAPNALAAGSEIYDEGDFTAAYEKLMGVKVDNGAIVANNEELLGIVVKDSTMYVYTVITKNGGTETDKLQIWKLKLGKFKKSVKVGKDLTKDIDTNAVKKDGDADNGDIIDFNLETPDEDAGLQGLEKVLDRKTGDPIKVGTRNLYRWPSVSIDTTGNVWALEKGKVHKYDGKEKTTLYTVDRAMNAIDAYDENNIIIWDMDGDVYTNISEGKKRTAEDGVVADPNLVDKTTIIPATVGWKQEAAGWNFYDATGTMVVNNWANVGGVWYYLKADGVMATGWQQVGGTWYYLAASGAMQTGWINDNGTWYYCNASGAMLANTTVDGYVLGASGAWIK